MPGNVAGRRVPSGRLVRSRTAPNLVYRPSSTAALQPRIEQLGSDLLAEIVNRVYATIGHEAYKAAVRTVRLEIRSSVSECFY